MSTFGSHMLHASPSLFLFVLHFCTVCQSDYHQPSFSTSTPSQTYHLWHHTLLSGRFSIASPHPATLPTPPFVSSTKLILFTHHPTDLFHKQPALKEGGDAEMSASQSNNQAASLPAKHCSFPSVVCKAHLLEAALDAISNSILSLNLPESF